MDDKQARQKDYEKKKFQQTKHKKIKEILSEQEKNLILQISGMNAKVLISFLQEKYDKLVDKNEKLLYPLTNQIIKRVPKIKEDFIEEWRQKINKFIAKHTNRQLSEEQLNKIYKNKWNQHTFETKPKVMTKINYHKQLQNILVVIINPNQPGQIIQHFYFGNQQEQIFYQVTFKRVKKESLQILNNFITLESKAKQVKYQV